MQPLRWKQGEEPWELSLLSTAVGNMSSEAVSYTHLVLPFQQKIIDGFCRQVRAGIP